MYHIFIKSLQTYLSLVEPHQKLDFFMHTSSSVHWDGIRYPNRLPQSHHMKISAVKVSGSLSPPPSGAVSIMAVATSSDSLQPMFYTWAHVEEQFPLLAPYDIKNLIGCNSYRAAGPSSAIGIRCSSTSSPSLSQRGLPSLKFVQKIATINNILIFYVSLRGFAALIISY